MLPTRAELSGKPTEGLASGVRNAARARALMEAQPQGWMERLGAWIAEAEPGRVVLELIAGPEHRHGGGVVQGGVITQIADAAMGMSLATLQPDGMWNTTIELKINFLRPVVEGRLRAVGRVIEMRQTLLFSEADVLDDRERLVARASSTCMPVPEGEGRE
ncbi:MAG TPA: PaaI family thioesterase [Candidatus Limnocylindrales bacterium]|nr:PaaI family thioesterase [Candidatus Limnocylindrales bacterium]